MKDLQARMKNPVFIMAFVAFLYQMLKHFNIDIDRELLMQGVDLASYLLIGTGIYKTFSPSAHVPKEYVDKDTKSE